VRKRKWDAYASGEELFGLPLTSYPELEKTQEEVAMLDKLYRWGAGFAVPPRTAALDANS
jgi:hypothetical protein